MSSGNTQTYVINFKANADGVDKVKKQFENILQMEGVKDNLTKPMQEAWNKLQGRMTAYLTQMNNELSKDNPDIAMLKTLDKEFTEIINKANKFNVSLQGITLPKDISEQLDKITKKINDANKEIARLQNSNLTAAEGLDARTKTGFKKGSAEEDKAFMSVKGDIDGIEDLNNTIEVVTGSWQEYKKAVEEAIAKQSPEQQEKYKATLLAVEAAIKATAQARSKEVDANNEEIKAKRNAIADYEQYKKRLIESASATNELTEAQKQLNNATQTNAADISKLAVQQQNTKNALVEETKATKNAAVGTKELSTEQDRAKNSSNGFGSSIGKAAKQVISYGTIVGLLRKVYRRTIDTITDMDKALTDMTVVTSLTRDEAWGMVGTFQTLATETGKTSAEIANITTKFLQQGKSISQAITLTEAAAKAATIAGISGERSVDLLTNALNGFQLSANQAMEVSDKFAALAAASATDYEEMAVALSKVAAQANLAGMSMDFTLGLLAKGIETTREAPETIGTALKTVLSRMRELTDYGKTLEEGTDVNRVAAALSNIGVELMDANGQFRDMEQVLTEVGTKWDKLNKNQQANVAVAMAGTRQQSRFIAMMQDFERTQELVDISAQSYGATLAQSSDYMRGMEAAVNNLTVAWESLITTVVQSDLIIGIVNILTGVVNTVTYILDQAWILHPLLLIIGVALTGMLGTKLMSLELSKQEAALTRQDEQLKAQARIQELEALKEERKAQGINAAAAKKADKEKILNAAKLNQEQIKQNKLDKINLALNDENLSEAKRGAQIAKIEAEFKDDELAAQESVTQAQKDYKQASEELAAIEQGRYLTSAEQLELDKAKQGNFQSIIGSLGIIGTLMSSITIIQAAWNGLKTMANGIQAIANKLHAKRIALIKQETAAVTKETAAETANAGAKAAGSVAAWPFWGWAVALAILAAIGIAIGVTAAAANKGSSSVEDTGKKLEDLQVKIYDLGQSYKTVQKLGDEFEELSSKIVQSTEDAERLDEIVQQLNDEGANINTAADRQTQLNQIKQYEVQKERELQEARQEVQDTFEEDFDDFGKRGLKDMSGELTYKEMRKKYRKASKSEKKEMLRDNYIEQMTATESGRASIRTMAVANMEGLEDIENQQLQNAIMNAAVENFDQIMDVDGNIDFTDFTNTIMDGIEKMDSALADGSIAAISSAYESLGDEQKELLKSADPMFEVFDKIQKGGEGTAEALTAMGYSLEDLNMLQSKLGTKGLEKFIDRVEEINTEGDAKGLSDLEKKGQAFEELVAANEQANADRLAAIQAYKDGTATEDNEYAQLVKAEEEAIKAQEEAQKEYDETMDDKNASDKEKEDAKNKLNETTVAANKAKEATEEYEEAANKPIDVSSIIAMSDALFDVKTNLEMTDEIKSLSSSVEQLSKTFDLANLSISEQLELLKEYPTIAKYFDKEVLTADDKKEVLQEELDAAIQDAEDKIYAAEKTGKALLSKGDKSLGTITIDGQAIDTTTLFDENNVEARTLLAGISAEEKDKVIQQYADNFGIEWDAAEEAVNALIGYAEDYNFGTITRDELKESGLSGLIDDSLREKVKEATSQFSKSKAEVESFNKQLERLDEGSDAYDIALKNRNNALKQNTIDAQQSLGELDKKYAGVMDQQISSTKKFSDLVRIENGQIIYDAEEIAKLDKDEADTFALTYESYMQYAEERIEIEDQILENNEALAESYIEQAKKEQEAIIETKEKEIEALEERKEAYEKYFDELDALEEEQDKEQDRDSLVKQIQALSGGADAASKQKIKELQQQLNDLDEEALNAQREKQREALLESMDEQIDTANEELDKLNETLDTLDNSVNRLIMYMEGTLTETEKADFENFIKSVIPDKDKRAAIGYAFKEGGLVDYTGPAQVHGTKANPEAFLSAADTRNMRALLDALEHNRTISTDVSQTAPTNTSNVIIENITIQTNELNNNQDWRNAGQTLASEFEAEQRKRGINQNVNTRYRR